jgi:hypothetical protein
MNIDLCNMEFSENYQAAISVQANLRMQVKPRSGGRSQNIYNDKNQFLNESSVSVQANLLQQVKPRRDGRSQNRRLMRGLPI